jgi:hypothetical protein
MQALCRVAAAPNRDFPYMFLLEMLFLCYPRAHGSRPEWSCLPSPIPSCGQVPYESAESIDGDGGSRQPAAAERLCLVGHVLGDQIRLPCMPREDCQEMGIWIVGQSRMANAGCAIWISTVNVVGAVPGFLVDSGGILGSETI